METETKKWFHFIGIAGVGMGGLAKILQVTGQRVSGSDLQENAITADLRQLGVTVYPEHRGEQIVKEIDYVVISSAIPEDNPELQAAKALNIPVIHRGELLARMVNCRRGIAIAGSHGKTTTTAMVYEVLKRSALDPYLMVGGEIMGSTLRAAAGSEPYFVTEADESDGSFLALNPFVALVTNVEDDHLDHYGSMENLIAAFAEFIENVPTGGFACLNSGSETLKRLASEAWTRVVTYGEEETDDYRLVDYQPYGVGSRFIVWNTLGDEPVAEITLQVPGHHNALNALGAFTVAMELGCPIAPVKEALEDYRGTKRRFEIIGSRNEIAVVDDYAHHPTELKATLKAAREVYDGRIVAVFQPHRYTRTSLISEEFGTAFLDADVVVITDIYSAGEKPIPGVDGTMVYKAVKKHQPNAVYIPAKDDILNWLNDNLKAGDMLLTLGAGDIWKTGRQWLEAHAADGK